jgi:hypothetical protein
MKRLFAYTSFFLFLSSSCIKSNTTQELPKTLSINKSELMDKIKGGWAGQVIGCTYGGPTEFKHLGTMIQDYIPIHWNDSLVTWYYDNFPGL